jgi:hypothetical protein
MTHAGHAKFDRPETDVGPAHYITKCAILLKNVHSGFNKVDKSAA